MEETTTIMNDIVSPTTPGITPPVPGPDAHATFTAFVQRATADPAVAGLVLTGSMARAGMATAHSDYDLYVILEDGAPSDLTGLDGFRSTHLDLAVGPLAEWHTHALPGDATQWNRYSFVGAQVVLDRRDGEITSLVERKASLSPEEADEKLGQHLDAYINSLYRSLKSHRDGRPLAARLDATESIPYLLTVIFTLHHRVRPYNKYLQWDLETHPLSAPRWAPGHLIPQLEAILTTGDPTTQQAIFADVEAAARTAGHGATLDAWGTDLNLLRPRR
jgi:hypothetical protein